MKNEVIKVLTKEHGKKVIQYWKDRGFNVDGYKGVGNEADCSRYIYYGVINGRFDNYSLEQVQHHGVEIIELPNEEPVFKVGDKVYDYQFGWGEVIEYLEDKHEQYYPIVVRFSNTQEQYTKNGGLYYKNIRITLSFTEYTLQGFSQERPIELPKVGELCLFYDDECDLEEGNVFCGRFQAYKKVEKYPYKASGKSSWTKCKRIKILD